MSGELPTTPPQAPLPPRMPAPVAMVPRWIFWAFSMVVLPLLPWLTLLIDVKEATLFVLTIIMAVVCQIGTSLAVGLGIGRKNAFSKGNTVWMCILFTFVSLGVATVIFFVCTVIHIMIIFDRHGN
jgi:hypothetical protein